MSHLWPPEWYVCRQSACASKRRFCVKSSLTIRRYDISDGADALENIASVWAKMGYDKLGENDYARLEPFLEPFDAVYNDEEITVLSRLGHNGVQKEFCRMFSQPIAGEQVWVLEWYLPQGNVQRMYLCDVALTLYGAKFNNDETQCMIMLTHALASLRKLKLVVRGETIQGMLDSSVEELQDASFEDATVEEDNNE